MFQDFTKRKVDDYLKLLEFTDNSIMFDHLRHSTLPPYIISFIDFYVSRKKLPIAKADFADILRKALIFNINYLIRPKYSLIRFLFGEVETRPVEYIKDRLKYFQFYGYYTSQISEFIDLNSLEVVSVSQIEYVIDEINKKIYEEISNKTGSDPNRLNLVKLLYYFFHDLGVNNPINIKLPKKILSVFFADKGFSDIKKRVDNFFSDEVFIQEAIEIMNPRTMRSPKAKTDVGVSEVKFKEIISRAKSGVISKESSSDEIEKILPPENKVPVDINISIVNEIHDKPDRLPKLNKEKIVIDENIYSDDLVFESHFSDMTKSVQGTEEELKDKLIEDLFCEETYRKKIVKKLFGREELSFKSFLDSVLTQNSWHDVTVLLEDYFKKKNINFYSEEAVKFVDILQSHFVKETPAANNSKAV